MRFAEISMLHGLWLVGILFAFLLWTLNHRRRMIEKFVESKLLGDIAATLNLRRYTLKNILLTLVLVLSVLALARPQWGFEYREVKRQGLDILLVVDVSKSMLTEDVKPNRLERVKLSIQDLLKKLKGDRIGLVAFAGDAFLVCPLTVDYGGFLLALKDLSPDTVPRGGTDLERAVKEAMKGYEKTPNKYKAVIVMTDGESLEGDPLAAARQAQEKGIKIFTIGVGAQEGELIRLPRDGGSIEFLKDDRGNYVKSRLNEKFLREIAQATGGAYVRSTALESGLELIYDRHLSKMEKRDVASKVDRKYFERFQIPLGIALLLLLAETCISTRKKI